MDTFKQMDILPTMLQKMSLQQDALPKSALGKAIKYCLNQWPKLTAFMLDGRIEISNNKAERAIKPFVIGRKNFLFSKSPNSIIETAKSNDLNSFYYLNYLFEKLPNIDIDNNVKFLVINSITHSLHL